MSRARPPGALVLALAALLLAGCGGRGPGPTPAQAGAPAGTTPAPSAAAGLPGMPPVLDPANVYAADGAGRLAPAVRGDPARVYVPNSGDGTVDVLDQASGRRLAHFATGRLPQHVTPSWDLRTLWVDNDLGNSLTAIDPRTGRKGRTVPVADPYNLYFTPDGGRAIVVAEKLRRLDFRDPRTMRLRHALDVPGCPGVDHMDFSADGSYLLASCEFGGSMIKVDVAAERVVATLPLRAGGMPQDVKLAPDGQVFYVADMMAGGVWVIDGARPAVLGFVATGAGAHGLYPSRDAKLLYVSNRDAGTISVLSFASRRVVATWRLPAGSSPDMGGVSADGRTLWLSGRYDAEVYAIDTASGRLRARIPVGRGPHGLCVWPQPGRYSLGHTGVLR
jgi:DNA-binding beta-propeller fold protein YncE